MLNSLTEADSAAIQCLISHSAPIIVSLAPPHCTGEVPKLSMSHIRSEERTGRVDVDEHALQLCCPVDECSELCAGRALRSALPSRSSNFSSYSAQIAVLGWGRRNARLCRDIIAQEYTRLRYLRVTAKHVLQFMSHRHLHDTCIVTCPLGSYCEAALTCRSAPHGSGARKYGLHHLLKCLQHSGCSSCP
jgi:hypothetical protein